MKKILVVDDDHDLTQSVQDLLEGDGYEVKVAHDGQAGMAAAKEWKPDLMLLDVMMTTDTEGFELSRAIAETPELKGLTIIMVTGIRHEMNLPFSFEKDDNWLPVSAILEKPVDPVKLLEEVKNQLG